MIRGFIKGGSIIGVRIMMLNIIDLRREIMSETFDYYLENNSEKACIEKFSSFFLNTALPEKKHIKGYKDILLKCCENGFQKLIIKIFYHPV